MHNNQNNVIIKLDGRMGNQMFQWAFGRALEERKGRTPIFDDSRETLKLGCFKLSKDIKTINKPLWNKILRKIIIFRNLRNKVTDLKILAPHYSEKYTGGYQPELFEVTPPACISGYFQTEKYFLDVRDKLLKDFEIKGKISIQNQLMLEKIKFVNSVSVHFRRGDYTKARVEKLFGMCSENYYKKAIDTIAKQTQKPITLFIFSDDINWVKNNVKFDYETIYVDINSGKQGVFDLDLMKNCKHNVIANSSFSWWGAWLNENPDKIVVAPTPWHDSDTINSGDIVPDNWIRIPKK